MNRLLSLALVSCTTLSVIAQEQSARPSAYTLSQAEAGRKDVDNNAFGRCGDCHTSTLTGRTGTADEMPALRSLSDAIQQTIRNVGGKVPPLVGSNFRMRWGSRSTKDLIVEFDQRFGSDLTEETRLNIIAYLLQASGGSPGTDPLTTTTDIKIDALLSASSR